MTARRDAPSVKGVRGGTMRHVPVLLPQVLQALAPRGRNGFLEVRRRYPAPDSGETPLPLWGRPMTGGGPGLRLGSPPWLPPEK